MAKLVAFYCRTDENYSGGGYRYAADYNAGSVYLSGKIRLERQDDPSFLHP